MPSFERLPRHIVPVHYDLWLKPDLAGFSFTGSVRIHLRVEKAGNDVVKLNVNELDVQSVAIKEGAGEGKGKPTSEVKEFKVIKEKELLEVTLAKGLEGGQEFWLSVEFSGILNDQMRGFYRTKQKDGSFAAACHFEATGARKAFPCWDEPVFRSTFKISLTVPKDLTTLSNMPEISREPEKEGGECDTVTFGVTPKMPSYLTCWTLGNYDHVEGKSERLDIPVRVFTPKGKAEDGRFALEVAVKALEYYSDFFGVSYPLPKIDLIALEDFAIGAMENWGLLTFRERFLLNNDKTSSGMNKEWVALIVAHEVAHQWFGNLVTVEWWTHLWLKEGYATWIEFLCVDHLFPSWKIWTKFLTETFNPARELDSLHSSHPIEVEIQSPEDIDEIFDKISYYKGSSIIRMLFNWMGEEKFKKGMKTYLQSHSYGCASTSDLWRALEDTSSLQVSKVMSNWTSQQGYPVLKITSQDTEKGTITLRQSVFLLDKKSGEKPELWSIPVTVASSSGKTVYSGIISEQEETIQLEKEEDRRWINVNPNQIGFYRVQYPKEMIQSFVPAIRDRTMPLDDRLGLIYDQLALVEAGMERADELLELLGEYREEDHGLVWEAIVTCLDKIGAMLDEDSKAKAALNTWTRWLLKPAMARLGWQAQPDEGHIQGMFRSTIVRTLIGAGDEEVIKDGAEKFKKGQDVHADLKSSTFRAVLISEGRSAWDKLTKIAGETDNAEEQARIYAALGSCQSADLVQETLNFAMSDKVRSQDTRSVFVSVSSGSTQGRNLAWAFFKAQKAEIAARYKVGGLLVGLVNAVLERFATEEMALEVESFFRENPFPGAERGIKQCLEKIRLRAEWKDRDMEQLKTYLDNKIAKFD